MGKAGCLRRRLAQYRTAGRDLPWPAQAGKQAVNVATELCVFLECAHHFEATISDRKLRSLVHGDLKPRNVRITSAGHVKVLDFGIAKALSLSRKVTRNDFGTMPYLSPERLDTGEVNELADLWAVGVMLYEMVRGTAPSGRRIRAGWSSSFWRAVLLHHHWTQDVRPVYRQLWRSCWLPLLLNATTAPERFAGDFELFKAGTETQAAQARLAETHG